MADKFHVDTTTDLESLRRAVSTLHQEFERAHDPDSALHVAEEAIRTLDSALRLISPLHPHSQDEMYAFKGTW